jgi:hypothetical protein
MRAHASRGQPGVVAYIGVDDDRAMADTVLATIHAIPGVGTTETHIVAPVQSASNADRRCPGPEGRLR